MKCMRKMHNITQKELAKNVGITQKCISFWERNERIPNVADLWKIADYYGISIDELIGRY